MENKNIKVGQVELIWLPSKKCWAIPGMAYESNERIARETAKRMDDAINGRKPKERLV